MEESYVDIPHSRIQLRKKKTKSKLAKIIIKIILSRVHDISSTLKIKYTNKNKQNISPNGNEHIKKKAANQAGTAVSEQSASFEKTYKTKKKKNINHARSSYDAIET